MYGEPQSKPPGQQASEPQHAAPADRGTHLPSLSAESLNRTAGAVALLQTRAMLDEEPRTQTHIALQRALNNGAPFPRRGSGETPPVSLLDIGTSSRAPI